MAEFGIAEEPVRKNALWHLAGRCVTDISVGTRFLFFVPHREEVHLNGDRTFYQEEALPIDLTILEIHAYGRVLQEWSADLTALLVATGNGENLQSYGSLLSKLPENFAPGQTVEYT